MNGPALAWSLLAFLIAPELSAGTAAYTITTYAGSDLVGDNGPATRAFVSILEGVCSDAAGNIYVADADDNRVRRIDTSGIVTTYAGTGFPGFTGDGGPANQASLHSPFGIRMDANGNLFIADLGNNRIREVSASGTMSTAASGLNQPRNLAFDPSGTLYVSEFGAGQVPESIPMDRLFPSPAIAYPAFPATAALLPWHN